RTANRDWHSARAPIHNDDDVVVSWCPLYHDMGLVFLLTYAMTAGSGLVLSTPTHFIASPGSWMEAVSAFRGTWTIGPNFSLVLAARMLKQSGNVDLSSLRGLGNGAEPIDPAAMRNFQSVAAQHGFDPSAMYGAYGMA